MMRDLGRTLGDAVFENLGRAAGRVQENTPLPADLLESDDEYLVVFDAPGVSARDVQVRYTEDRVEVRLDRFRDVRDDFEMRYPGRGLSLEGEARLPDDAAVDADEASATLREDGTLAVRIPKVEPPLEGDTVEEASERADAGTPVDEAEDGSTESRDGDDSGADTDDSGDGPVSVVDRIDGDDDT